MEKEYSILITVSEQISEDRWLVKHRTMKANGQTTLAEIETWYRRHLKAGEAYFTVVEIEPLTHE